LPCLPRPTRPFSASPLAAALSLAPILLALTGSLAGCGRGAAGAVEEEPLRGALYQLQEGRFTPTAVESLPQRTAFQPWTVQERVSDLLVVGERVYLGINGYGVAEIAPDNRREPEFNYFYEPQIFHYRTLTTLIPEQDGLLCHLYFNSLLNVVGKAELDLQGISLLRLDLSTGGFRLLTPPYQEQHPEWEAVGFVPVSASEFYLQWKYDDRNRTLFSYSRYDLAAPEEREVEELSYRKSYRFQDVQEEGSAALKRLFQEARAELDAEGFTTAYQLNIRSEDQPLIRRYEYHPRDFANAEKIRLLVLSGVRREDRFLLLLPDGLLLSLASGGGEIQGIRLPALPEGFVYGDFLLHGEHLVAGWEQPVFTEVGAAGIFLGLLPLIR
jgi:hypothetical protein